jgi:large subunit ribosomal protein L4
MEVQMYNQSGEPINKTELPDKIFGLKLKPDLMHQVLTAMDANSRQVLAHTKGRGEVRGGGKKPWRQKGTGRARHASIRSPIWKGGGVAFGPTKERNFKKKINKKMKRQALFMSQSSKIADKQFLMLDDFRLENPKTKEAFNSLKTLSSVLEGYRFGKKMQDSVLIILSKRNENVLKAVGNLPFASVSTANDLNIRKILENKYLILTKDAVGVIEKTYKI